MLLWHSGLLECSLSLYLMQVQLTEMRHYGVQHTYIHTCIAGRLAVLFLFLRLVMLIRHGERLSVIVTMLLVVLVSWCSVLHDQQPQDQQETNNYYILRQLPARYGVGKQQAR